MNAYIPLLVLFVAATVMFCVASKWAIAERAERKARENQRRIRR